jgi:hypothetical protein
VRQGSFWVVDAAITQQRGHAAVDRRRCLAGQLLRDDGAGQGRERGRAAARFGGRGLHGERSGPVDQLAQARVGV